MPVQFQLKVNKLPIAVAIVREAAKAVPMIGAEATAENVRERMREMKSGRHYYGMPNVSAAPGEAPAVQQGDLIATVDAIRTGENSAAAVAGDGKGVFTWQEFGTSKMPPHPSMVPAAVVGEEAVIVAMAEVAANLKSL